jgi:spermidine synthase
MPEAPRSRLAAPLAPRAAGALVFFTSAAILVLEILAGRLLAPYTGVTLETYTAIIGVVLAGISLGTWAGGRMADRFAPRMTLGPLLVGGGVLALAALPLVRLLGGAAGGSGAATAVVVSTVAFGPPAAVLSAVTPNVVKLQLEDLGRTGEVVGRLSALATAGAILGTFLTGFVLIAALPTAPIVIAVGGALVAAGLLVAARLGAAHRRFLARSALAALIAGGLGLAVPSRCEEESTYFCARIDADPARASGRVLVLDSLRHSYVDLRDPTHLEFAYTRRIGDLLDTAAPPGRPLRALHIGGGGFTLPRYLAATRPGSDSLVLEIDANLVGLVRERLGLQTGPRLRVRTGDARVSLRDVPSRSRDMVIGDAFGGLAVPWHLTTREFVRDVRRVLGPGGAYALNVIDAPPLGFARAETATLLESFRHVAVVAPAPLVAGRQGGNVVLLASDAPLPLEALRARAGARDEGEEVASGSAAQAFAGEARVLRDDFAPVDQLLTTRRR